jgi:PTS system N-acetylglucosamine-specific IIC component
MAGLIGGSYDVLSNGLDGLSHVIVGSGRLGLFVYGLANRILIVTGLHHILNNVAWFIVGDYHGATGDLKRFFAGDPTAGSFMAGFFPVMMFGLPAACLAMYHAAPQERRRAVGGLLMSMALTSFLTGVTEPIEFSFIFLAPVLFAVHAVLTGLAFVVMDILGVKLGFGFSAGLFDYVLNFGKATRPLLLVPVGLTYFALYYGVFRWTIVRFNLKTPGRDVDAPRVAEPKTAGERAQGFVSALGGAQNLVSVDACTTRLRLVLVDAAAVDEAALRSLGALGLVRPSAKSLQVVLGPIADQVAGEIREAAAAPQTTAASKISEAKSPEPLEIASAGAAWLAALGGKENLVNCGLCASRVFVELRSPGSVDDAALTALGARGVARPHPNTLHVLIGPAATGVAQALLSYGIPNAG